MLILVSGATVTVRRLAQHPNLGRLVSPAKSNAIAGLALCGLPWAADNGCYTGLDAPAYLRMLDKLAAVDRARLLFVTVPDVVAEANQTLRLFHRWLPELVQRQLPPALVAQDGLTPKAVPWSQISALFIGGSTHWKLSGEAARLILVAKARGLWVHVGRISSPPRAAWFAALGADSCDGTKYSRYADTHLPRMLAALAAFGEQPLQLAQALTAQGKTGAGAELGLAL